MPGLVINGKDVPVEGLSILNYRDAPRLRLRVGHVDGGNDGRKRTATPQSIILHTTKGIPGGSNKTPQTLRPGRGPHTRAEERVARFWSTDPRSSGAHMVVDADCSMACLADLELVEAYHASGPINARSIGIEVYQDASGALWAEQLEAVADLVDALTLLFGIQRTIPDAYRGELERLRAGGRDFYGVIGHRDCTDTRGRGDPGDFIFEVLARRGYERRNLAAGEDLEVWKERQRELGVVADGIPGPRTCQALLARGYRGGLWALPPAPPATEPAGLDVVGATLDAFSPAWAAQLGGRGAVVDAVAAWVERRRAG